MNYKRYYVPNAVVFITQVIENRDAHFADPQNADLFLDTLRNTKALHPFKMHAYAILPDHFHLMIQPDEGTSYSKIMHSCKSFYVHAMQEKLGLGHGVVLWQKRFWTHVILNEDDYARHLDYVHINPCKHGYVQKPEEWAYSSYKHWCDRNVYASGWGWDLADTLRGIEGNDFGEE